MSGSKRLKQLSREIEILRREFLPDPFDPLGNYPKRMHIQTRTRAFIVLSHAEFESYLEEWAKDIARRAEIAWNSRQRVTLPLVHLVATGSARLSVPDKLSQDALIRLASHTQTLFQNFYTLVKNNNGVKEANFLSLFLPLGLLASAISPTLLQNLETFGSTRGSVAHHSRQAVQNVLDPATEYQRVLDLLADLIPLDSWLAGCWRQTK